MTEPPSKRNAVVSIHKQSEGRKRTLCLIFFERLFVVKTMDGDSCTGDPVPNAVTDQPTRSEDENLARLDVSLGDEPRDVVSKTLCFVVNRRPLHDMHLTFRITGERAQSSLILSWMIPPGSNGPQSLLHESDSVGIRPDSHREFRGV